MNVVPIIWKGTGKLCIQYHIKGLYISTERRQRQQKWKLYKLIEAMVDRKRNFIINLMKKNITFKI